MNQLSVEDHESGFYAPPNSTGWNLDQNNIFPVPDISKLGLADHGTRLLLRVRNIPVGVRVLAGTHGQLRSIGGGATTGDVHATATDTSGGGIYSDAGPVDSLNWPGQVSLDNATAVFVWEVLRSASNATERVTIPLAVSYQANAASSSPALGVATADGQTAPLSTVQVANATAPIPRFGEDANNNGKTLFQIAAPASVVNRGGTGSCFLGSPAPPAPTPPPSPTPTPAPEPVCIPNSGPSRGGPSCTPAAPPPSPTPPPDPPPTPPAPPPAACAPPGAPNRSGLPPCP